MFPETVSFLSHSSSHSFLPLSLLLPCTKCIALDLEANLPHVMVKALHKSTKGFFGLATCHTCYLLTILYKPTLLPTHFISLTLQFYYYHPLKNKTILITK